MEYIKISPEVVDRLKEITDLAEKIMGRMHLSNNPELAPIDFFLFFFMQRAVNIGRSLTLLIENGQHQDAWIFARMAFEGRCYILKFQLDPSLANKWVLFYIHAKYIEEDFFNGKDAAERLLAGFAPEIVTKARDEFGEFGNLKKSLKWHKYYNFFALFEELKKKKLVDEKDYFMFFGTFSDVVHWAPLGVVDAEKHIGAVIGTTFTFMLEMSITVNSEFVFGFENDIADIQRRYVECVHSV
jgi:hypothetical protein